MSSSAPYWNVFIESLALEVSPHRVASKVLEDELSPTYRRLGIPAGCFESLVGIAGAATTAARKVYSQAGNQDLLARTGLVISTSVCKDYLEPSVTALSQQ